MPDIFKLFLPKDIAYVYFLKVTQDSFGGPFSKSPKN